MTAILGKDANGNIITIDKADRREGLYIIGSSGTGKSTLLTTLIQSDITDNIGLCLLDPHGDLIKRTIELMPPEKYKDVILLEIANPTYAFGVNLFHCKDTTDIEDVENIISQVMHLLDKVYSISTLTPMMNNYFLNLTQTLLYNPPSSILDIPRLLGDMAEDKKYRAKLSANVPNIQTQRFWASFTENRHHWRTIESIDAVKNKLDDFFRPVLKTIFGQEITTINMREIMDDPAGKILLVKMNARWESITKLVGSVIVGQILDAAYSRADIPIKKRRHFSLYADEFQWFASQDFSTLFSEARKYGIGLTIAHQTLEQVDPHIIATCKQAKTIISFRVSGDNAESLATQFDTTPPEPEMEEIGKRKKQVPVTDVVNHLLKNGHKDHTVNNFAIKTLRKLNADKQERNSQLDIHFHELNMLLYNAMVHKQFDTLPSLEMLEYFLTRIEVPFPTRVYPLIAKYDIGLYRVLVDKVDTLAEFFDPTIIERVIKALYIQEGIEALWLEKSGSSLWTRWINYFDRIQRLYIREAKLAKLKKEWERIGFMPSALSLYLLWKNAEEKNLPYYHQRNSWQYHSGSNYLLTQYVDSFNYLLHLPPEEELTSTKNNWYPVYPEETWYHVDFSVLELSLIPNVDFSDKKPPVEIREKPYYVLKPDQYLKFYNPADLDKAIETELQEQKAIFLNFFQELKHTMQALATTPILGDSGEEEIIYRPGPQQTYADKEKEIANMLSKLPNMQAYARVTGEEHTITVEQINQGMHRQALSKVIANITEQNVEDGYIRLRSEVEVEIEARQNPPEDPPPSHSSPNRPQNPTSPNRPPTPPPTPRKRKIDS